VEDATDAHVVSAALQHFGMETVEEAPTRQRPPPILAVTSPDEQVKWVERQAREILGKYVMTGDASADNFQTISVKDSSAAVLDSHLKDGRYVCPTPCTKSYKLVGNFKRHLVLSGHVSLPEDSSSASSKMDELNKQASVFTKLGLVTRDMYNAYQYGDGARVFRNIKLMMLYFQTGGYTKYALWLWRMLAFQMSVLSARDSYEYMWNICTSTTGGLGRNIPNDNLVECTVWSIKEMLRKQGGNVTFASAQEAASLIQVFDDVADNFDHTTRGYVEGRTTTKPDKTEDVLLMVKHLHQASVFQEHPGRRAAGFSNFEDPLCKVDMSKLFTWMSKQKDRIHNDFKDFY
jgi:hypothetical protein